MSEQQAEAGGAGASAGGERTLTQAEVNAIVARERKAAEERATKAQGDAFSKMQAELEALRAEREDAGKSAAEKAAAQAARERATYEAKLAERDKALAEHQNVIRAREQELRDRDLGAELTALMSEAKVLPSVLRHAQIVFRSDARIEHGADGRVSGVELGDRRFGTVKEALAEWMRTNGATYVAAPTGGAGTRAGTGVPSGKPMHELNDDELMAIGNQQRAARR